jgi:hypothetical protein
LPIFGRKPLKPLAQPFEQLLVLDGPEPPFGLGNLLWLQGFGFLRPFALNLAGARLRRLLAPRGGGQQ